MEYPPNYQQILQAFPIKDKKGVLFCHSPFCYNPDNVDISSALMAHEDTHCAQQMNDPKNWWDIYIDDVNERLSWEMEAHIVEVGEAFSAIKDRNQRNSYLISAARRLSSPMYGALISFPEALERLKKS